MTASPRDAVSQNKMNNETATNLSIRDLVIRNPGFAIHPLEWTAHHLELVNCHFQNASAPPDTKAPVYREDSIEKLRDLLDVYCWRSQLFIDLLTNEGSPLEHMEYVHPSHARGSLPMLTPCPYLGVNQLSFSTDATYF